MTIPKFITRINKHLTNKLILLFAGWLPPFAVIHHTGRHSGHEYKTPVLAFRYKNGLVVTLTYGRNVDWLKNLIAKGSGSVELGGRSESVSGFQIEPYHSDPQIYPIWVRFFLSLISVKECLHMNTA